MRKVHCLIINIDNFFFIILNNFFYLLRALDMWTQEKYTLHIHLLLKLQLVDIIFVVITFIF